MKNDLIRGWKLMRYGLSAKGNIVCMVIFFVVGLTVELVSAFGGVNLDEYTVFDMGAVFLSCAVMFPAQLLISLDVGVLAQSSGYKRKLQTSMPAYMMGVGAFFVLTLVSVIRTIVAVIHPETCAQQMQRLVVFAVFEAIIIMYSSCIYKFFVLSMVVLYIAMIAFGGMQGYLMVDEGSGLEKLFMVESGSLWANPAVCIIASYVLILLALCIQYGISRLCYKRPLSRYAFGAAMKRNS